jgi:hypothetical protein
MGKTIKLRDKDGSGITELELKTAKRNNGLKRIPKMKPFTKKKRI